MEKNGVINNQFYDHLGEEWNERTDHPIALLRAENRVRNPWIVKQMEESLGYKAQVLDIGCGAGLLTNHLAEKGFRTTGVDLSAPSLDVAKRNDQTKTVRYVEANAYSLPFDNDSFDGVTAMDVLEHVEEPQLLIAEAARVLRPGGLFFFHTFNRNWLSYFLIIKGVDWFVKNAPKNMHVYPLFIKPHELEAMCDHYRLKTVQWKGLQPKILSRSAIKLALTRQVPHDFTFKFTNSLKTGYCGIAVKQGVYDYE